MTTINNATRKLAKKILNERVDELTSKIRIMQNTIADLNKTVYNQTNQETLYNMNADEYEANLNTQLNSLQDRKQKLKDYVDWADEQVLV